MLIETAKRLRAIAGERPIPVRCNVTRVQGHEGGVGHFSRGSLVGIRGDKLLIKPYRHGGKLEPYDPKLVNIWTSRAISNGVLTQEQIDDATNGDSSIMIAEQSEVKSIESSQPPEIKHQPHHDDELRKRLEQASQTPLFVIADLGYLHHKSIQFYMGRGSTKFASSLADAFIYDGDLASCNAHRSLGQLKRRSEWTHAISGFGNLKVIPYDEAKRLYEDCLIKGHRTELLDAVVCETVEGTVVSNAVSSTITDIVLDKPLNGHSLPAVKTEPQPENKTPTPVPPPTSEPQPEAKETPKATPPKLVVAPAPVVTPVPQPPTAAQVLNLDTVQKALNQIQASMINVQAALDMLREERQKLLDAQAQLVGAVATGIDTQIQRIDAAISEGSAALYGKKGS